MRKLIVGLVAACFLVGCDEQPKGGSGAMALSANQEKQNVLSIGIDGWSFVGPSEVPSGWTTVRINNDSGMIHHALVYRLPEGVTDVMMADLVIEPVQKSLTARLEGDVEKANQLLGSIPEWFADIVYVGGPGMMSDGIVGEATMYLEPGDYIVECYVKTNGMQHNYNPEPGMHGMVLPVEVTSDDGGMAEPNANVTLAISTDGFEIVDGAFKAGTNSVRVNFVEQQLYNGLVGLDAHVFRVDPDTNVADAVRWVNPFSNTGQETPGPAHYVGGIHDMPQGANGYFKVDLEEGDYGIVAEVPGAFENGFFTIVSVTAD